MDERRPSLDATEVHVSGSFDNWTQRHELRRDPEQHCFAVTCRIPVGKVYYKFIVDGEWCTSAADTTECDEHGNVNNVVVYEDADADGDAAVIVHDSDGSSEFTSISHPASETRWEEVGQTPEAPDANDDLVEEADDGDGDDDLTSSVQITLRDTSSVTASVQSRTAPAAAKLSVPKHGDSFMSRIRSIFHK